MIAHTSLPALGRMAFTAHPRMEPSPSLLDALGEPAFLLTANAVVLYANAPGMAMLASRQELSCTGGRLQSLSGQETAAIEAIVAEMSRKPEAVAPIRNVTIAPSGGRASLVLTFMRWKGTVEPHVLAIIQAGTVSVIGAASRFGLTTMEAALAEDLLTGAQLKDIAARRGRRISTLRTQLSRLMAKTGTNRQAELVSLLMRTDLAQRASPDTPALQPSRSHGALSHAELFHINDNEVDRPRNTPKTRRPSLSSARY
jgi:DNA-binding CsgD family transcriptional regulator